MHRSLTPSALVWGTLLVILLLYSGSIGRDVVGPGESRVAQLAWEMQRSGDYLLPTYNGEVQPTTLTKPPLYHWLVIATAAPFDWQDFSLRIVSILSLLASIWLTWRMGRRLFGAEAGAWSAVILGSALVYVAYGLSARMDLFFATLVLAAMSALWEALESPQRRSPLVRFFILIGLAMMVKGPAGFIIPVGTALALAGTTGGWRQVRRIFPWWGLLAFLVIGLGWYLIIPFLVPAEVARSLFWTEPVNWMEGNAGGIQTRFWYYLPLLLGGLLPWSLFLLGALVAAVAEIRRQRRRRLLFLLFWFLGGLLLFSLGGKKAIRYLLPILPAAALLTGWYLARIRERGRAGWDALVSGGLITLIASGLAVALLLGLTRPEAAGRVLLEHRNPTDKVILGIFWETITAHPLPSASLAILVLGISLVAFRSLMKVRIQQAVLGYAFFSWVLLAIYFHALLPTQAKLLSPRPAAAFIRSQVADDQPLYGGGKAFLRAMHWYLRRDFDHRKHRELLELIGREPDRALFIMHRKPLPESLLASRPHCQWRTPKLTTTFFPALKEGRLQSPACPEPAGKR